MPNTRPGLTIGEDGVCSACKVHDERQRVDWDARWEKLRALCDKHRRSDGQWDCLITVSSGKDSAKQIAVMKEEMGMNPLLISVGNLENTEVGQHNAAWMSEEFGCHLWQFNLSRKMARSMFVQATERLLAPTWAWDLCVYSVMYRFAIQSGIRLLVFGENVRRIYSGDSPSTPSARDQMANDVVKAVDFSEWLNDGVTRADIMPLKMPTLAEMDAANLEPIYLSHFINWSGYQHAMEARERGWWTLDDGGTWRRQGQCETWDQTDTASYLVHPTAKYWKLAHRMNSDRWANAIREGRATREEAVEHIIENEHIIDPESLRLFLAFVGKDESWWWGIVDDWANRRMLGKRFGQWRLKPSVVDALMRGGDVVE